MGRRKPVTLPHRLGVRVGCPFIRQVCRSSSSRSSHSQAPTSASLTGQARRQHDYSKYSSESKKKKSPLLGPSDRVTESENRARGRESYLRRLRLSEPQRNNQFFLGAIVATVDLTIKSFIYP
jgi:hypothetical protein